MTPNTDKTMTLEEYEKQMKEAQEVLNQAKATYRDSAKKVREHMRKIKQIRSKTEKVEYEKLHRKISEVVEKQLNRRLIPEDVDRLEKILRGQMVRLEASSRIEEVLGRPLVREDLDRLENFLHGQETRGNHFTRAMSGEPQETELSTLSTLKNGLRSL